MSTTNMAVSAQSEIRTILSFGIIILLGIVAIAVGVNVLEFGRVILIFDYQAYFYPTSFLAFLSFFFFLYFILLMDSIFTRRLHKVGAIGLLVFNALALLIVYKLGIFFKGLFEVFVHPESGELSTYKTTYFLEIEDVAYAAALSFKFLVIGLHLSLIWGVYNLYRRVKK